MQILTFPDVLRQSWTLTILYLLSWGFVKRIQRLHKTGKDVNEDSRPLYFFVVLVIFVCCLFVLVLFTDLHQFVSPVSSARGTCNDLSAFTCAHTTGTLYWKWWCGDPYRVRSPRGVCQHPTGTLWGLERHGRAEIPSLMDATLGVSAHRSQPKERGQCHQDALQVVVDAGYRAAYENCGTKRWTAQQKKTTDLSNIFFFWWCLSQQIIAKWFWFYSSCQVGSAMSQDSVLHSAVACKGPQLPCPVLAISFFSLNWKPQAS